MSYNIYDKTTDTLKKVAGRVANGILNTLSEVKANASENVSAGSLAVKELAEREDYSTEEKVIGTWIDGKPIYRKVIETTYPNVVTDGTQVTKNIDVSDLSIDFVTTMYGTLYFKSGNCCIYGHDGVGKLETFFIDANKLYIRAARLASANKPLTITIEYTKTTD